MCRMTLVAPRNNKVDPRLAATLASHFVSHNSLETGQDDGSGLCMVNKETTVFQKDSKPGYSFAHTEDWTDVLDSLEKDGVILQNSTWLGHARAATFGIKVTTENAHPFMVDWLTGMHNGTIKNKTDFAKNIESDSAAFFAYLAEKADSKALTLEVLTEALEKIRGAFCMLINDRLNANPSGVWVVVGKQRELWATRNDHFLVINTSKMGFSAIEDLKHIFKSLGDGRYKLLEGFSQPVQLTPETIFWCENGGLKEVGKVKENDYQQATQPSTAFNVRSVTPYTTGNSAKLRKAAFLWATALETLDLSNWQSRDVMEALYNTETNKRMWTSLNIDELENLSKFVDHLEELGYLKNTDTLNDLWASICSNARRNHDMDYSENPYVFLSTLLPSLQFPYWMNSQEDLEELLKRASTKGEG